MEQEEYEKEKINWSYIEFIDNQDVLDLIEKVGLSDVIKLFKGRLSWFFPRFLSPLFCLKEFF